MPEKTNINLNVETDTAKNIERLMKLTHRGKGDVIDWLVADAMDRVDQAQRETVTVEQALDTEQA